MQGLPPTTDPPTTAAPDRSMVSALCCPLSKGPYPRAVGRDFLLSGGSSPCPQHLSSPLSSSSNLKEERGPGWVGKGVLLSTFREQDTQLLLPGRNVAVVHVSRNHNADPASVSLKEPQTQKPSLLRMALPPQSPTRSLEEKGLERGAVTLRQKRRREEAGGAES